MLKDIIVEGVDRLGKDTLIKGLQDEEGFFQEVHYQKPLVLRKYLDQDGSTLGAMRTYQRASFTQMFMMLSQPGRYVLNRAHLGEAVYAPRYRKYDGNYVFDMERSFTHDHGSKFTETTLLVLLTTSDFSFIEDDGLSLDFDKKEEEQEDFKRAFDRSTIKTKLMIDVNDGASGFKPSSAILEKVLNVYREIT